MTIPNTSSTTPSIDSFSSSPHIVRVGELEFGDRTYIVSIESPNSFISSPNSDTIEKIQYLVDLHLTHLKSQGIDLSTIFIQQLDEEGLSYVNEDLEQKSLQSSELSFVSFNPFNENSSSPMFLYNEPISSISDIYRSIIDSLTQKTENQETKTSTTKSPSKLVLLTPEFKESLIETPDVEPRKEEIHSTHVSSHAEDQSIETEDETLGLLTGEPKEDPSYNPSSIKSKLYNFALNIWNSLPSLGKIDSSDEPIVNTQKIIEEEQSTFRSGLSELQKSDFDKFTNTRFQ